MGIEALFARRVIPSGIWPDNVTNLVATENNFC